jgi:hypothetical protein
LSAHEKRALAAACDWLVGFSQATSSVEEQVDRLFGIWACTSGLNCSRRQLARFRKQARRLPQFEWFRFGSDPLFVLAVYRAMISIGLRHASLSDLNVGYCSVLRDDETAASSLGVIVDLLRANGGDPCWPEHRSLCLPDLPAFVTGGRAEAIKVSRDIMMASSCGTREICAAKVVPALPGIAFSYARDWDIGCTCAVLRACAYLGCGGEPAARWATDWLLDQQQSDGRFDIAMPPADSKAGDSSSLDATIDVVWAIAELNHPGFLLKSLDARFPTR